MINTAEAPLSFSNVDILEITPVKHYGLSEYIIMTF